MEVFFSALSLSDDFWTLPLCSLLDDLKRLYLDYADDVLHMLVNIVLDGSLLVRDQSIFALPVGRLGPPSVWSWNCVDDVLL